MNLTAMPKLLQPRINGVRSADITDVVTNTAGGLRIWWSL